MNLKVVIALNMYDELERSGDTLNYRDLGRMIGIPIIPTVANRKKGSTPCSRRSSTYSRTTNPSCAISISTTAPT